MKKAIFFVIFLLLIFLFLYYNTSIFGNNIVIKNENKIVDYISSIKNYSAEIEVIVNSNKTTNVYNMKQEVNENYSVMEVTNSGKINGLKIELAGNKLSIQNTELNLNKVYENYNNILNNSLFLNTFIEEFNSENSTTYQEDNMIIMETENKKLYVDINTAKPVKLEVKDNTKKTNICIIYNNIEIK